MTNKSNNVLIVDDEPKVLKLLERVLEDYSFNLFTEPCGQSALKFMAESPEMAVVVSNYHMGSMNGGDFLKQVKVQSPKTIRIMMTAGLGKDKLHEMKGEELIHTFTLKPIIIESFASQIITAIELYLNNK
jgi:DNA-binding NtrC family response regulator